MKTRALISTLALGLSLSALANTGQIPTGPANTANVNGQQKANAAQNAAVGIAAASEAAGLNAQANKLLASANKLAAEREKILKQRDDRTRKLPARADELFAASAKESFPFEERGIYLEMAEKSEAIPENRGEAPSLEKFDQKTLEQLKAQYALVGEAMTAASIEVTQQASALAAKPAAARGLMSTDSIRDQMVQKTLARMQGQPISTTAVNEFMKPTAFVREAAPIELPASSGTESHPGGP